MLTLLLAWWRRRDLVADPRFVVRAAARQSTTHAQARVTVATAAARHYEVIA